MPQDARLKSPDHATLVQSIRIQAWSRLLILTMIAALGLLLVRVVQLKMDPDARFLSVMAPRDSSRAEFARRGDLLDARDRIMATSTVGRRLFIDPAEVEDLQTVAVDIARAIGARPDEIDKAILSSGSRRYVVIRDLLDDRQARAVGRLGLRGVGLEPRAVRHYPQGDLAAMVVGMVGFEHTGLSGGEHSYERALAPRQGRLTYLRDVRRKALWIEAQDYDPADDGRDVRLTIDLVVQQFAHQALQDGVVRHNAGGGRVVVLDCRTGGILAMCDILQQRPGWDEITSDPARRIHRALGRNRCVTDPYEPGSTMKPFVWAAATELGVADPAEILPTPAEGAYRTSYGRRIRDSHMHGPLTWREVLVKSVNSGMAMVAERMTHQQMREAVLRFGFGTPTACGIAGESAGLVVKPGQWSHYTQSSVSFGHEIGVTPVQMARAFAAFARDGTMPALHLTARDDGPGGVEFRQQVCSPAIAAQVRCVLRDAVLEGTGRPARSDRYEIFGKSGTAQLPRPEGGGYFEDRYVSSFVAGAPCDDPRIVVLGVVDDPDRAHGHFGGVVAGPIVRDIIDQTLEYLGVAPLRRPGPVMAAAE